MVAKYAYIYIWTLTIEQNSNQLINPIYYRIIQLNKYPLIGIGKVAYPYLFKNKIMEVWFDKECESN